LTRWPSYVRDRHAAITYTTPRDAPLDRGFDDGADSFRHGFQREPGPAIPTRHNVRQRVDTAI
ncbi:hypothetical protein GBO22_11035, partial [Mycobacterium avium subsp. hominissuis]|nr:hypothetical protein [Mycobacterium avium subsp. hominissuis]